MKSRHSWKVTEEKSWLAHLRKCLLFLSKGRRTFGPLVFTLPFCCQRMVFSAGNLHSLLFAPWEHFDIWLHEALVVWWLKDKQKCCGNVQLKLLCDLYGLKRIEESSKTKKDLLNPFVNFYNTRCQVGAPFPKSYFVTTTVLFFSFFINLNWKDFV